MKISYIGYLPKFISDVVVKRARPAILEVKLKEAAIEAIKKDLLDLDLSSLVLDTGKITVLLSHDDDKMECEIDRCFFVSANEQKDLEGNATLSFNYEFPITPDSVKISYEG